MIEMAEASCSMWVDELPGKGAVNSVRPGRSIVYVSAETFSGYEKQCSNNVSIRASHPTEPIFVTIRHRIKGSKGCLSRGCMLCMMFKMGMCAEDDWHLLVQVRNTRFDNNSVISDTGLASAPPV
tara:strand:+ start:169 stop:543 length:375 start_codon:yes stop_codon:yes gene_type:complete